MKCACFGISELHKIKVKRIFHPLNLILRFFQQLMSIIKTLQAKIAEDAMTKAMMELRIREEVAEEMTEQINEIENMYRSVFSCL